MKNFLRALVLMAVMGFAASWAYADNVTVSTSYPSPYGSYQNLDTSSDTHLATTSGNVGIGTTNPNANEGTSRLTVSGSDPGAVVDRVENTGTGLTGRVWARTGGTAQRWNVYIPSGSTDLRFYNSATDIMTMQNGGFVGIGTATPGYQLHVGGAGTIGITKGGNTGELKVAKGSDNNYYAVYAP